MPSPAICHEVRTWVSSRGPKLPCLHLNSLGHSCDVQPSAVDPPYDQLLATAECVARERPEVDTEMAREVFAEAATLLYNGLALEGLDDHDAHTVVAGLCVDLVSEDPGAAVRQRTEAALEDPSDLHDPQGVAAAYEISTRIMQL